MKATLAKGERLLREIGHPMFSSQVETSQKFWRIGRPACHIGEDLSDQTPSTLGATDMVSKDHIETNMAVLESALGTVHLIWEYFCWDSEPPTWSKNPLPPKLVD